MRNPVGAVSNLVLGLPLTAAGTLLLGWVVVCAISPELGREATLWALGRLDKLSESGPMMQIATSGKWLFNLGFFSLFPLLLGIAFLRAARIATRAPDESDEGTARIELREPPQVGRPLEGSVQVDAAAAGEKFSVELCCTRATTPRAETAFREEQVVAASPGGRVAFRFAVPITAPDSTRPLLKTPCTWQLRISREKTRSTLASFDLHFAPAPPEALRAHEARQPIEIPEDGAIATAQRAWLDSLPADKREQLKKLPPEQLAQAMKMQANAFKGIAWIVGGIFALVFVLFFLLPAILLFIGSLTAK